MKLEITGKIPSPQPTIKRGDVFIDTGDNCPYIVAQVAFNHYCLVSLTDGNRFSNPSSDIDGIFSSCRKRFVRVENYKCCTTED